MKPHLDPAVQGSNAPHRGRRKRGAPSGRLSLLHAATAAFADRGYENADLRSIAAAAGVPPNLVRVHFGSKATLWEACLEAIVAASEPVTERIAAISGNLARPVTERLRDAISLTANFYAKHPEVRDFIARDAIEPEARSVRMTEALVRPAYNAFRPLLEEAIASGVTWRGHPAVLFAVIHGAVSQPQSFPLLIRRIAPEIDIADARRQMTEAILQSLIVDPTLRQASALPPGEPSRKVP